MSDQIVSPRRVSTAYILGFSNKPFKESKNPDLQKEQSQMARQRPRRKSAIAEILGTPGGLLEWSASDGRKGVLTGKGKNRLTSEGLRKIPNQLRTVEEALAQGRDASPANDNPHAAGQSGNAPNNANDSGVDKWTIQQDRRLMQLKNENGIWRDIAVDCGKTQEQCKARWKLIMPDGWVPKAARNNGDDKDNSLKEEEKAKKQHNKQCKKKDQHTKKNKSPKSNRGEGDNVSAVGGLFDIFSGEDDVSKNDTPGNGKDSSSNTGWGVAANETPDAATGWGGAANETTDATTGWGAGNDITDATPAWGAGNDATDATQAWGATNNEKTDAVPGWETSSNAKDNSSNKGWQQEKTDAAAADGWNNTTNNPPAPKSTTKTTDSKKVKGTKKSEAWDTDNNANWVATSVKSDNNANWDSTSVKSGNNEATPAWGVDLDLNLPDGGGKDNISSASWGMKKGSKKSDSKDNSGVDDNPWAALAAALPSGNGDAKAHSTKSTPHKRSHRHRESKHGSDRHETKKDTHHHRDSNKDAQRRSHRETAKTNDSSYVKLRPDETFNVEELIIIARILRKDSLDVWERLSYRFRDKTGRNIPPRVFEKKINGFVEDEESDVDSWNKD